MMSIKENGNICWQHLKIYYLVSITTYIVMRKVLPTMNDFTVTGMGGEDV